MIELHVLSSVAAFTRNSYPPCGTCPNLSCLAQLLAPIMSQYRQVETCLECSSMKLIFTGEVFSYAVKAVMNPVAPLFDVHGFDGEGQLKDLCVRALRRVFIMCDHDQARSPATPPNLPLCRCLQ